MTRDSDTEFREFVATRLQRLASFAFALCHDWHQAEDVVQNAVTRLYRKWRKVHRGNPDAYVRRIIVNLIHDDRRSGWFRREQVATEVPPVAIADPTDATARRLSVIEALGRLPTRQRQAVVLRHWEDMSVRQTADVMGCSEGTVKTQTARGLKALGALLDDSALYREGVNA